MSRTDNQQTATKTTGSSTGAPAQRNQSSRKGKRAWRKNVDLEEVEEGLETARAEERVAGGIVKDKTNEELFLVDVKGEERVRKSLPRFSTSLLTSAKILAQRSAIPALFSRGTEPASGKRKITYEEKGRLLRIAKRPRHGPFNAVLEPGQDSVLDVTETVKQSGKYDVWSSEFEEGTKVKQPNTPHPRTQIALPAVPAPHEGTSYNPLAVSHQELLRKAHDIEVKRFQQEEALKAAKDKILANHVEHSVEEGVQSGMSLDKKVEEGIDEVAEGEEAPLPKKIPARKTRQERQKAERLRSEKRVLAEKVARKRLLASVDYARVFRKQFNRTSLARERMRAMREEVVREKLAQKGLAGKALGKHRVPEGEVEVQLGEDLTESLRQLKPEGNLFRDRMLSMQQRALVEPRALVAPRRRTRKIKEYEKHAWKRFDREN